jgi:hypothetical protein
MVIDLVLKFDDNRERVLDFTINSLGNIIVVLFASGKARFLDVDILKKNYDNEMPEYLINGEISGIDKLPCDDLARTTGIISGDTFKKVSKFKIEYFQKARDEVQKKNFISKEMSDKENIKMTNQEVGKQEFLSTAGSLFDWKPINKLNGLNGSLCNENNPPKFGLVKLKRFLRKYGAFPNDMRLAIWGYLLNIPLKKNAFDQLKFLGEYDPTKSETLGFDSSNHTESLRSELLQWKSKWNLKTG